MSVGSVPDFVDRTNRLTVMIGQDVKYEKKNNNNRDSFISSIGDLSSSFTVDLEDQKAISSPTDDASSSYTMPDSPTDEKEMMEREKEEVEFDSEMREQLSAPVPPPPVIRVSLEERRHSQQQLPERTTTPSRPPTRPETMDFDL